MLKTILSCSFISILATAPIAAAQEAQNPGYIGYEACRFCHAELKALLNDVRANIGIIARDGSHGIHNPDYALEIMAQAAKELEKIKAELK